MYFEVYKFLNEASVKHIKWECKVFQLWYTVTAITYELNL